MPPVQIQDVTNINIEHINIFYNGSCYVTYGTKISTNGGGFESAAVYILNGTYSITTTNALTVVAKNGILGSNNLYLEEIKTRVWFDEKDFEKLKYCMLMNMI
jgi:hypothetical protein